MNSGCGDFPNSLRNEEEEEEEEDMIRRREREREQEPMQLHLSYRLYCRFLCNPAISLVPKRN